MNRADLICEIDVDRRVIGFLAGAPPTGVDAVAIGAGAWECAYDVANSMQLRRAGYPVRSPIQDYYAFPPVMNDPSKPPGAHQKHTAGEICLDTRFYCLNKMATGKTYSLACAADYLMSESYVRRALVLCPKSTMIETWFDTIDRTFDRRRRSAVVYGTKAQRLKQLEAKQDFYILNHDGFEVVSSVKKDADGRPVSVEFPRDDIDLVIVDELAIYRNVRTQRWALLNAWFKSLPNLWVVGATGNPIPEDPTDAYAQARLLRPWSVPKYFGQFRKLVQTEVAPQVWVDKPGAVETVYEILQPSVQYTKEQCWDLPPTIVEERRVDLSADQAKHFREVLKEAVTEFESGEKVVAVNESAKITKLIQIACGSVYSKSKNRVEISAGPRIAELNDLVEFSDSKTIVFVPYTNAVDYVARELRKRWTVETVTGAVSDLNIRTAIFRRFQNERDPRVLVADAGCMSHGLTLTAASTTVWYGPEMQHGTYEQANERAPRPGQAHVTRVVHLFSTPIEKRFFDRLAKKAAVGGALSEMLRDGTVQRYLASL